MVQRLRNKCQAGLLFLRWEEGLGAESEAERQNYEVMDRVEVGLA